MKNIENLFCQSAQKMSPYSPIEPPDQIAKRLGLPEEKIIKLDANENPFGTAPKVLDALAQGKYYHIYPDPAQVELRTAIANYVGCNAENIVAGTGADELIDIVCRLLLEPEEKVVSFTPTFGYYSHVIALNNGTYETYERGADFSISLEKAKAINLDGVKLVILCSPNNPSGNILEEKVLDYFLGQDVIVLLDEAYYEFSKNTWLSKIKQYDNLIILRTFSKCFGLAGLRVGYGIASQKLAGNLMRIKPPYSVNVAAEVALKTCLNNIDYYADQVQQITRNREWTQAELQKFQQLEVTPSLSNFILCRVIDFDAKLLKDKLEEKGILVRYFATNQLKNYIRISIGTKAQMETFISVLQELIK